MPIKKITLSIAAAILLSTYSLNAGAWDTIKENANNAIFWKSKHLENVDFEHIYPKPFYKKSYFGFLITGAVIVGAGSFTYFTAGAGAPVAATGASAVAAWLAGGGAGSYMAGLSTIGSWFGGNAILGAAILNGISIATIGGGASTFTALNILGKFGVMASVTAMSLDGVAYFANPETKELEYKIKVMIPKNLGSKDTRKLVNWLNENKEDLADAIDKNNGLKQKVLYELNKLYNIYAIELLKTKISQGNNPEDMIVLGIFAWNNSEYELFDKAISSIDDTSRLKNKGFLNYLSALKSLADGNSKEMYKNLNNSISENPYALEPYILYINALGNEDFQENKTAIEDCVQKAKENYDSDKYATDYTMTGLYYRMATFYFNNEEYEDAKIYYKKALKELGLLQKYFFGKQLKHTIQLGIANSLYENNDTNDAKSTYQEIISDIDDNNSVEYNSVKEQYLGNEK